MATAADPRHAIGANDPPAEAQMSIADLVAIDPGVVLTDEAKRAELFAHLETEIAEHDPDLTTAKGREAIKAFAFRITKTKTAVDGAGKAMNENARAQINVVDAARRIAKAKLEALAERARAPLTAWEQAEEDRVARCREIIASLKRDAIVTMEDTAESVRVRGGVVYETAIDVEVFGDLAKEAEAAKSHAVQTLIAARARLQKEEADRAELEQLRAAQAERDARDAKERAEREAAERVAAEAKAAEERRAAADKAEAERIARAKEQAAADARREAEVKAQREREAAERAKQAEIDAANERAAKAEADAQAERDRATKAEADRLAKIEADAAEQARLDKNRAHRTQCKSEAKIALMAAAKIDEAAAVLIVKALIGGAIPHATWSF